MNLKTLKDKKVIIWGFGKEGHSVLRLLQLRYPNQKFVILNENPISDNVKKEFKNISNLEFKTEEHLEDVLKNAEVIIKSPGISLYKKEIIHAKNNGTIFTSSTNLWFAENINNKSKTIVITGTKGKSTVASLIAHLLKETGKSVKLAGNIGIPLVDLLFEEKKCEFYVLELSSYQISDLQYSPDIGVLLNLYPEHIEWHKTHKQYYLDKLNLFAHQKKGDKVILNYKDKNTKKLTKDWKSVEYFNNSQGIHVKNDAIYDGKTKICSSYEISLKGPHNLINVCAALTVLKNLGFNPKTFIPYLRTFQALDHRLQEIWTDDKGRRYINDSISTIPESAIAAIDTFKNQAVTLIAGGLDRQQNYSKLALRILSTNTVKNVITLPDTGNRIIQEIKKEMAKNPSSYKPIIKKASNMEGAVKIAKKITKSNGTILLSPAAPSYNAYKNFQERGKHFEELVKS